MALPTLDPNKLKVALSICRYLNNEIRASSSSDMEESLTVAIQCVEAAYGINYNDHKQNTNIPDLWNLLTFESGDERRNAELLKEKGNHLMSAGLFKQAVELYSQAIDIDPQNAVYYCNRAAAFHRLENYKESVKDAEAAVKIDPSYSKAYGRLGSANMSLQLYAEAVEAYTAAIRLDPTNEVYKENFAISMESYSRSMAPQTTTTSGTDNPTGTPHVQSAIHQIVNNPTLLNMASEMLSDETVRNAMSGLINMQANGPRNTSMESLLQMGQQLAHQMQQDHPDFIENLRRQFVNNPNNSSSNETQPSGDSNKAQPDPKGNV